MKATTAIKMPSCIILLGLLAAVGVPASTASSSVFPYYPCVFKAKGPYSLVSTSRSSVAGGTRYCWNLQANVLNTGSKCDQYDLKKIAFDTAFACAGSMKDITFNGTSMSPSLKRYNDSGVTTKITRGVSLLATFKDVLAKPVEVCFTLSGSCAALSSFCTTRNCANRIAFFDAVNLCCPGNTPPRPPPPHPPSPKPPAPPVSLPPIVPKGPFPYVKCIKPRRGPYSIITASKRQVAGGTRYCFDVIAQELMPRIDCTQFGLSKIEFDIAPTCDQVKDLSFNGKSLPASYTRYNSSTVFRVTRGDNKLAHFEDTRDKPASLCFTLPAACALPKFCAGGACKVAFFSNDQQCCPVVPITAPPPPPPPPPPPSPSPPPPDVNAKPPVGFPWSAPCNHTAPSSWYLDNPWWYNIWFPISPTRSYITTFVCWRLLLNANATGPCAQKAIGRVELPIEPTWKHRVLSLQFYMHMRMPPKFVDYDLHRLKVGSGHVTVLQWMKPTGGPLGTWNELYRAVTMTYPSTQDVPVCMLLKGEVNDPSQVCLRGRCWVSILDQYSKCCPVHNPPL